MARPIAGGQLSGGDGVTLRLATESDDAELRRLLRDNPMGGAIRVSLEREPNYFSAAAIEGSEHYTIVAEQPGGNGRLICCGGVSIRERYVNGEPMRVGYLGGLRLDHAWRGRAGASVLRGGYAFFREQHERRGGPPVYLTSIAADNAPARRFLERELPGMPTYQFLGEFVTLLARRRRRIDFFKPTTMVRGQLRKLGYSIVYGDEQRLPAIAEFLANSSRSYQLAPVWTEDLIRSSASGPGADAFRLVVRSDGSIAACMALWDQRQLKQAVVRGYSPALRRMRPLINLGCRLTCRPTLPAVGQPLSIAFLSHLAGGEQSPDVIEWLVWLMHGPGHTRRIDSFALGFDARDPRLANLRRALRPREYRTRLYAVHFDDRGAALVRSVDGSRLLAPEVAIL